VLTEGHQPDLDEVVTAINARTGKAIGVVADSADPAAPKLVFAKAIEAFGQVDIMVNNAGYRPRVRVGNYEGRQSPLPAPAGINYLLVTLRPGAGPIGRRPAIPLAGWRSPRVH